MKSSSAHNISKVDYLTLHAIFSQIPTIRVCHSNYFSQQDAHIPAIDIIHAAVGTAGYILLQSRNTMALAKVKCN